MFKLFIAFCFAVALVVFPLVSFSSEPDMNLNEMEFENWVKSERKTINKEKPVFCNAVLERVNSDRATSDMTIKTCVYSLRHYDEHIDKEHKYKNTLEFIGKVQSTIKGRTLLSAELAQIETELLVNGKQRDKALEKFALAREQFNALHIAIDKKRIANLVSYGELLLYENKVSDAETIFLEALSYPWYLIEDDAMSLVELQNLYIRAGFGLIDCRRGNLTDLENIAFVPAAMKELGPALDEAKKEAAGN